MTIIACSATERIMISDTLITSDEHRFKNGYAHKIVRGSGGSLAGAAGDSDACCRFLEWVRKGRRGRPPAEIWTIDKEAEGLVLTAGAEILWYCGPLPEHVLGDYFAIGYGAQMCLAAMRAGASLGRAVEIVCELSGVCGGPITELKLDNARRKRK